MASTMSEKVPSLAFNDSQSLSVKSIHRQNLIRTIILGSSFMLVFTGFSGCSNIISKIYEDVGFKNLGQIALFTLYICYGFTSLVSAGVVARLPYKLTFSLSALGYGMFVYIGFLIVHCTKQNSGQHFYCSQGFVYPVIIIISIFNGMCASTLWVAQGGYLAIVQKSGAEINKQYIGIFWSIFQVSLIIGNLMSIVMFQYGRVQFFTVMSIFAIAGQVLFAFVPNINNDQARGNTEVQEATLDLTKFWNLFRKPQVRPLLVLMAFTGVQIAFTAGFLYKLVDLSVDKKGDDNIENQRIGTVLIVYGFFEVLAGLVTQKLMDYFDLYVLATVGTLIGEVGLILSMLNFFIRNYGLCFVIGSCLGFMDTFLNTVVQAICTKEYDGQLEIFGIFRFLQATTAAILLIVTIFVHPDWAYILIVFFFQILATIACAAMQRKRALNLDNDEKALTDNQRQFTNFTEDTQ